MCMYVINICYHILEQLSISFFVNFLCKILTFSPILSEIYKKITVDKPVILCNNKIKSDFVRLQRPPWSTKR